MKPAFLYLPSTQKSKQTEQKRDVSSESFHGKYRNGHLWLYQTGSRYHPILPPSKRKGKGKPPANYQTDDSDFDSDTDFDSDFDTEPETLIDEETGLYTPLPMPHQSQRERRSKKKKNKRKYSLSKLLLLPQANCGCDWTLEILAALVFLVVMAPVAYMFLVWNNALVDQYVERSRALSGSSSSSSPGCEAPLDASPVMVKRGEPGMVMKLPRGPGKPVVTMSSFGGVSVGKGDGGLAGADVPTVTLMVASPTPTPSSSSGLIDRFWSEMLGV